MITPTNPARAMSRRLLSIFCLAPLVMLSVSPLSAVQPSDEWKALVSPDNSLECLFVRGDQAVFKSVLGGWGPNWAWTSLASQEKAKGDELLLTVPFEANKAEGQVIMVKERAWKSGDNEVSFNYELSADKDVPLTMLVAHISFDPRFQDGDILFKHADGSEGTIPLSIGGPGSQSATESVVFRSAAVGDFTATIDPPVTIVNHETLRIQLAEGLFKAGTKSVTITFHLNGPARFLAKQSDIDQFSKILAGDDWFPVTATNDVTPGVVGFQDWLDKPAGKHGGVRMVGDHFEFADKTAVKFWGTNLAYALCAPEKQMAEYTAARFAKFGVNAVRLHKFTGSGWEGIGDEDDATQMKPEGLDRMDYFANELAKNGIYYGWSHSFKFKVKPGNRDRLLAYDEIKKNSDGDTYALINWAEDCQDLLIETVVNLLKHENPYTGKTYAEDPALAYIELQNEDDIFFFTTDDALNKFPTYQKNLLGRYAKWLEENYADRDGLRAAWGDALKPDETFEEKNIALAANVFDMGTGLEGKTGGLRQRLLDNAAFFHHVQNAFYSKFSKAIREAGYKGPLVGSPWQAPGGLANYYNLKSDYMVGYIDRHNYFGGALDDTMLGKPGSGDLSSGLQQVDGRPFGMSEWIHQYPSLYSAEGPAIFAAYGMGLQGWDASYEYQSAAILGAYSEIVGKPPFGIWNVDVPSQIGQFPALARMIMRGDVKEGEVIGSRNITPENLAEGTFDFSDKVEQQGDVKTFTGNTPASALAAGRLVVKFTDREEPSTFPDMAKYDRNKTIVSNTRQLAWDYSGKGYFTVNTEGTKAVVGFAPDRKLELGNNYAFTVRSSYASLFLTSLEKGKDLSQTRSALLTAVARNCNTGFKFLTIDGRTIDNGGPPILLEPVKAGIACGRPIAAVNVLDQDGLRTGKTLPVEANTFEIDSAREKTIYYEVVFK